MSPKTRNIIMYVALGVLFVVATSATIYAVVMHYKTLGTDDHFSENENGWLGWCGDQYVDTPTEPSRVHPGCPTPQWDHTPIVVMATTDNPNPVGDPEEITRSVIERINSDVGVELLAYDPDADSNGHCFEAHSICVRVGVPAESGWMDAAGDAQHFRDEDALRCEVRTSNTGSTELLYYVVFHEMLHCLGLAHDTWEGSIMRETQSSASDLRDAPRISDHDRALLRNRYVGL